MSRHAAWGGKIPAPVFSAVVRINYRQSYTPCGIHGFHVSVVLYPKFRICRSCRKGNNSVCSNSGSQDRRLEIIFQHDRFILSGNDLTVYLQDGKAHTQFGRIGRILLLKRLNTVLNQCGFRENFCRYGVVFGGNRRIT